MHNVKKYEKSPVSIDTRLFSWCRQRESNPHSKMPRRISGHVTLLLYPPAPASCAAVFDIDFDAVADRRPLVAVFVRFFEDDTKNQTRGGAQTADMTQC